MIPPIDPQHVSIGLLLFKTVHTHHGKPFSVLIYRGVSIRNGLTIIQGMTGILPPEFALFRFQWETPNGAGR